jgi:hypothetical protein
MMGVGPTDGEQAERWRENREPFAFLSRLAIPRRWPRPPMTTGSAKRGFAKEKHSSDQTLRNSAPSTSKTLLPIEVNPEILATGRAFPVPS